MLRRGKVTVPGPSAASTMTGAPCVPRAFSQYCGRCSSVNEPGATWMCQPTASACPLGMSRQAAEKDRSAAPREAPLPASLPRAGSTHRWRTLGLPIS